MIYIKLCWYIYFSPNFKLPILLGLSCCGGHNQLFPLLSRQVHVYPWHLHYSWRYGKHMCSAVHVTMIMDKWGILLAYLLGLTFVHFYMCLKFCPVNKIITVLGQRRVSLIIWYLSLRLIWKLPSRARNKVYNQLSSVWQSVHWIIIRIIVNKSKTFYPLARFPNLEED